MVILLTGGGGFIGSNFLHRFVPRMPSVQFINLDAMTYAAVPRSTESLKSFDNYRFVHADIRNAEQINKIVDEARPSAIIHMAAETHVDNSIKRPALAMETNVMGTLNLLEAARNFGVEKFVHVSTDEVYGSLGDTGSFTEDSNYKPNSPYSAGKAGSDHIVRAYGKTYGLDVRTTHCSNNYGPRQFPEKLIPLMIRRMVAGQALPVYGQGLQTREWIHVDDHNDGVWAVLERGKTLNTYNVGSGVEMTNIELIHVLIGVVATRTGKQKEALEALITYVEDRPGHDWRYSIDPSKAKNELGWSVQIPFESGLTSTVDWYLSNPDWMNDAMAQSAGARL